VDEVVLPPQSGHPSFLQPSAHFPFSKSRGDGPLFSSPGRATSLSPTSPPLEIVGLLFFHARSSFFPRIRRAPFSPAARHRALSSNSGSIFLHQGRHPALFLCISWIEVFRAAFFSEGREQRISLPLLLTPLYFSGRSCYPIGLSLCTRSVCCFIEPGVLDHSEIFRLSPAATRVGPLSSVSRWHSASALFQPGRVFFLSGTLRIRLFSLCFPLAQNYAAFPELALAFPLSLSFRVFPSSSAGID